ncbi:MAG: hypothetical protein AAF824_21685 [Bacteroidota bacterium]
MTRFRSKHFPSHRNKLWMLQEFAIYYYGIFFFVLMLAIIIRVASGQSILWLGLIGALAAMGLGNVFAYAKLKRTYAEIFFLESHFSLISLYEIQYQPHNHVFPLRYANARHEGDRISLTFLDQIITLKREDWEDFDLIWSCLQNAHTTESS